MVCDIMRPGSREREKDRPNESRGKRAIAPPGLSAVMSAEKHARRPVGGVSEAGWKCFRFFRFHSHLYNQSRAGKVAGRL